MKKDIHPEYFPNAKIECACGSTLEAGSTEEKLEVEICSACHPFYTGKKKVVDATGRVDRFKKIAEKSKQRKEAAKKTSEEKKKRVAKKIETEASKIKKPKPGKK